ncbi:terminase small subunit [Cupriavidus taiwanensis]|uniref:terminase small subunit n=1 Tax=Cupriavidus taiwanensis TaxID=164546 RepID=UPI0039C08AF7
MTDLLDDADRAVTQAAFAELVGISQPAVSELVGRGTLTRGASLRRWLVEYCENLREQAAGRASTGDLDLIQERAALAREQRIKIAMVNQQMQKELAPVAVLEAVLAKVGRQIATKLEAIPVQIKRRTTTLSAEDIDLITEEITKARNIAAAIKLEDLDDGPLGDSEGDFEGP